jgi:hypothetical protein
VTIGGEVFVGDGLLFINDRDPRARANLSSPAASGKNPLVD